MISKKQMPKQEITTQGSGGCTAMFDVVTELASARHSLTFGLVVRGDGDKTKAHIRPSLSCGAEARGSSSAPAAALRTCSCRLRTDQIKICGYETKALLDCWAVFYLLSEKLCSELNLEAD